MFVELVHLMICLNKFLKVELEQVMGIPNFNTFVFDIGS